MIDARTRTTLRRNSPIVADVRGFIGRLLLLAEPGLSRQNQPDGDMVVLRQRTYLVELRFPNGKAQARTSDACLGS